MRALWLITIAAIALLAVGVAAIGVGFASRQYQPQAVRADNAVGDATCLSCHQQKSTYMSTAHHLTSTLPTRATIQGSFSPPTNVMRTQNRDVYFHMDSTASGFYETAVIGRPTRHHDSRRAHRVRHRHSEGTVVSLLARRSTVPAAGVVPETHGVGEQSGLPGRATRLRAPHSAAVPGVSRHRSAVDSRPRSRESLSAKGGGGR